MKCKYCEAELEEGSTLCPVCGGDNADPELDQTQVWEAPLAEEPETVEQEVPETKPAAKMSAGKLALVIVAGVVLLAALVGIVFMGMDGFGGGDATEPSDTLAPTVETNGADTTAATEPDPTVPSDGNPDDETCKGTYTADADTVKAANETVVATMGDKQLTNGQLQVYYWMSVYNFMAYNTNYYYYMDISQDLDTQLCPVSNGTWQQYFLSLALDTWQRYLALVDMAETAQFQMPEEYAADLETMIADMEQSVAEYGYDSLEAMLEDQMGPGCTVADYETYMYQYYMGLLYYDEECNKITVTEDEVAAYFQENKDAYAEMGITEETKTIDVRHILIEPEGGTTDASGTTTYTDEEWEAARMKAKIILDEWLSTDNTEEGFAALAKEHTADGNGDVGGLYEGVEEGQMVTEFNDWCFDESRQYGDSGLVKTRFGYHIMFFVGSELVWPEYAEYDLLASLQSQLLEDAVEAHPIEVDYSAILLGYVNLMSES